MFCGGRWCYKRVIVHRGWIRISESNQLFVFSCVFVSSFFRDIIYIPLNFHTSLWVLYYTFPPRLVVFSHLSRYQSTTLLRHHRLSSAQSLHNQHGQIRRTRCNLPNRPDRPSLLSHRHHRPNSQLHRRDRLKERNAAERLHRHNYRGK